MSSSDHLIDIVLYVNVLVLTDSDHKLINHVKSRLKKKFGIADLGYLNYSLCEGISLS